MKKSFQDELICRQEGFDSLTRERLEQHQLELINTQLRRARAVSPFYKEYPEHIASLNELRELPLIDAGTLRENFPQLCLSANDELIRLRTSGTTGAPKRVAYTEYDCGRTREYFQVGLTELIGPGDRVFTAFPNPDSNSLGGLIHAAVTGIGAVPFCMKGSETYRELTDLIQSEHTNVYIGPPVLLLSLLRLMGKSSPLRRALISGDTCQTSVMEACEALLGSRLFEHYGMRESGLGGAMACSAHEGMHIRENDLYFEVIGEDGAILPDGKWGELVLTSMGLEGMPLFRYRTGDFGRLLPGSCPCGSCVRRLETAGRISRRPTMAGYDELIFALDTVVDAVLDSGKLMVLVTGRPEETKEALAMRCRDAAVEVRTITDSDRPFFIAKRTRTVQ